MFSGWVINLITSFIVMLTVMICNDDDDDDDVVSFKLQQFDFLF